MRRDVTPRPGIFNWEKAEERGRAAVEYIEKHFASENVSFVDLKGINPVDVMYCEADAEKVIERFNQEKVDAVFIINSNFGNEEDVYKRQTMTPPKSGSFPLPRDANAVLLTRDEVERCRFRTPLPGDRLRPFGAPGEKPLRRFLTDRRLDAPLRPTLWLSLIHI